MSINEFDEILREAAASGAGRSGPPRSKICPRCGERKLAGEFGLRWPWYSTLKAWCKPCFRARQRERYARDREAKRRYIYNVSAKKLYGVSVEEYERILARQKGCCGICGRELLAKRRPPLDHDHETGQVRAILCTKCNQGLGQFDDDPMLLLLAAQYLEYWADRLGRT